ncbi:polysaccharide deacetylase family protein [Clostridia bacterium]|nr:polysaccharide deacetylase family protein [Clostridia bacterium]
MKYFLTFDGAPHPPFTNRILDILKEQQVHATFFVEGHRIQGNETLLKRIIDEGHGLGNHTYSHKVLTEMDSDEAIYEVERCNQELDKACGQVVRAFRPPWGKIDAEVSEKLAAKGYVLCCWNASVKDFEAPSAEVLAERMFHCLANYRVVVLHDHVSIVPEALKMVIPRLKTAGVSFERVEDYLPKMNGR